MYAQYSQVPHSYRNSKSLNNVLISMQLLVNSNNSLKKEIIEIAILMNIKWKNRNTNKRTTYILKNDNMIHSNCFVEFPESSDILKLVSEAVSFF